MKLYKLLVFLLITHLSFSQGFLRTQGKEIINDNGPVLLKSIGTGNWLIQEGYMMQSTKAGIGTHTQFRTKLESEIGKEKTQEFYNRWLEHHFTKRDLDSMKSWGFNAVRVALHYKWFTLPIEEEQSKDVKISNTMLEKGFEITDKLLSWCEENQMYLILDMHGAPGGQGKNANISDYDESKLSLWESELNKSKLVNLWVEFAKRYKYSHWMGGFDLINETNWDFTDSNHENGCNCKNNDQLWDLQERIIKAIREVNANHIVYISGNCWGNNYASFDTHSLKDSDSNMVLTFHKYWNNNKDNSVSEWINKREVYNIPLWMSESGENSNTWFSDCISLLEKNNIGWSWWPVKKSKYNNILKVTTDQSYKDLMRDWQNGVSTSLAETFKTVMQYADNHKIENCDIADDVIYAMIEQPGNNKTKPFKKHDLGKPILFADYDLGRNEFAYFDMISADYHVDGGDWAKWNSGGYYRNDGVDIGMRNKKPYVGWTQKGEYLQFTISVPETSFYNVEVNASSKNTDGKLKFIINDTTTSEIIIKGVSNEFDQIKTSVKNVPFQKGENKIRFLIEKGDLKLFNFKLTKNTNKK